MHNINCAGLPAFTPERLVALSRLSASIAEANPTKTFPLLAIEPQEWTSPSSDERVRVQGSPGFQVVYVTVDEGIVAIPLDVADQVARAILDHAHAAQLRTLVYLKGARS